MSLRGRAAPGRAVRFCGALPCCLLLPGLCVRGAPSRKATWSRVSLQGFCFSSLVPTQQDVALPVSLVSLRRRGRWGRTGLVRRAPSTQTCRLPRPAGPLSSFCPESSPIKTLCRWEGCGVTLHLALPWLPVCQQTAALHPQACVPTLCWGHFLGWGQTHIVSPGWEGLGPRQALLHEASLVSQAFPPRFQGSRLMLGARLLPSEWVHCRHRAEEGPGFTLPVPGVRCPVFSALALLRPVCIYSSSFCFRNNVHVSNFETLVMRRPAPGSVNTGETPRQAGCPGSLVTASFVETALKCG